MSKLKLPRIVLAEGSDPGPLAWLRQHAEVVEIGPSDPGFSAAIQLAQGLLVRTYTKVNASLLDQAPMLKVVGRGGVGIENIDVAECRRRGIEVVYTPDANTLAVGDFVFGYLLQLFRPWAFFSDSVYKLEEFKRIRDTVRGRQLNEMTIGILGMGRVGRRVGHIAANGFGMRVIYNDLLDVASQLKFAAAAVDKPTLLRDADILTLHVDMRPENENMISTEQLAQMKNDAVIVNTSRGEVLDANALAASIRAGKFTGAAIDVFYPEPPNSNFPLLGFPNVLLTPHLAARTTTAMENMSWVVRDAIEVLHGRLPKYPAPRAS